MARSRESKLPAIFLCIASGSFGVFTIADSYMSGGSVSGETGWLLPTARFLVHPVFVGCWLLLRRRSGRRRVLPPDAASWPAILLGLWFVAGAIVADDPVASLGRAIPLLVMIGGAFCVVGPSLASPRGAALLFRSAFSISVVLSSSAVAGVFLGYHPTWGLWSDRFYGPLSATTLGPVCVTGLLAALGAWRLTPRQSFRMLIGVASLWLFVVLIISRARGSYVFFLVGGAVYFTLISRPTLALRVLCLGSVGAVLLLTAWNWWNLDVSRSGVAAFLRLDERDMLAQRSEVWGVNASFWKASPVFGVGLGNEATMSEVAKRSHSAYLSTLNEGGVPAVTLMVISLVGIIARSWRTALRHPLPEIRLLGVLALAIVVGTAALGIVETTLINAASTTNTFVWVTAGASVVASRQVSLRTKKSRRVALRPSCERLQRLTAGAV